MKIIDTHSHLNFKAYKDDLDEVVNRTLQANVRMINVGTKYETSKQAVELAEKYEGISAAIGMHPIHITEEFDKEKYKELARSNKVVAIGEIGLDYYYKPKTNVKLEQFKEKQKKVFIEQLEFAKGLNLPVVLHCRMAHTDLIEILKSQIPNPNDQKIRGVVHCFTGTMEEAQKYIDLGFYIGFNGIIFKLDLDEVIKQIFLDKILVETDCPYLIPPLARRSPEGGGGRNEPIFIKHVIQKIAELKGVSFDEVADKTTQNAKKLFAI